MQTISVREAKGFVVNGTVEIAASFRRDASSAESKTVTLRFMLNDVNLGDIIADALKSKRISWQNNVGRKSFDSIEDRSVVNVDYSAPGRREKTPEELVRELANKTGVDINELVKVLEAAKKTE